MIEVVCAVIESLDGRILACQRDDARHLGGLWEFPGGKIDNGESAEDALIREIREELGIEIEVTSSLKPVIWKYEERTIRLHPYRCSIVSGEPKALEHKDIAWCHIGELPGYDWAAADLPIVAEIIESRGSSS